jgi:peptidoglycan/LPS O-acetylase OafA/YrhL
MHRKMAGGPRYRPDIDGLRAVAIVPVVLHHADVPGFGGGYVGVDVFFVISGYLITRLLLAEAEDGGISIMRFYARRVRRIAPALLIGGLAVLPAEDLLREAKNAVATLAFASNIRFAGLTGYFDDAATEQLLLHTWSLAVEEQYYLVFPLLLAAAIRARAALRPLLWAVTMLSFAGAVRWVAIDPTFAFYMLPARAWELLGGALLASGAVPAVYARRAREAASVLGFVLIAASVFFYAPQTNFPGVAALPPVLGAMLLIHAGDGTATGRLLSRPLPVGIGLISYSLYLWHWPILVLREQFIVAPGAAGVAAAIALSVALAWASWRWVERPFRGSFWRAAAEC